MNDTWLTTYMVLAAPYGQVYEMACFRANSQALRVPGGFLVAPLGAKTHPKAIRRPLPLTALSNTGRRQTQCDDRGRWSLCRRAEVHG